MKIELKDLHEGLYYEENGIKVPIIGLMSENAIDCILHSLKNQKFPEGSLREILIAALSLYKLKGNCNDVDLLIDRAYFLIKHKKLIDETDDNIDKKDYT